MRTTFKLLATAAVLLALSGCAGVASAPAGPLKLGDGQVTLGREWSDISQIVPQRSKKVRLLSIEGPLLNRLYLTEGLVAGDYMIKPAAKERPTPTVRTDMSVSEQIEFVADNVSAMDYLRVETSHPRPMKFGATTGVRFDIDAATKAGLEIKGVGAVARQGGKLYVVLYLAPAEHYFQASLPEVEAIIASAKVG
jgi:hypothetical protein